MSVYTRVQPAQLNALLADYAVGELTDYRGISAGITNTNYFVDTSLGRWVLTVFERLPAAELPYYLDLMHHLASLGVPSAHPVARRDGGFLSTLAGKPAALVYRLRGRSLSRPSHAQCAALGGVIAELHRAGETFAQSRPNTRDPDWAEATRGMLAPRLDADTLALLDDELNFQSRQTHTDLPRGVVHADLFRDNVLFEGDRISGLIDFYYACDHALLFDLAVVCNDWCRSGDNRFLGERWRAIAAAYAHRRPFTPAEHHAWPILLRAAALRFWVSRLYDWHFPRAGDDTHQKDPTTFAHILDCHRKAAPALVANGYGASHRCT